MSTMIEQTTMRVPITRIIIREGFNARALDATGEDFKGLVESIRTMGVLVPLIVVPSADDDEKYELIAGHRRLLASSVAGMEDVPVIVRDPDSAEVDAAVENMSREQLWPLEEARAIAAVIEKGYTPEGASQILGVSKQLVAARMKLLALPESIAAHWGHSEQGYPPLSVVDTIGPIAEKSLPIAEAMMRFCAMERRWSDLARSPGWVLNRIREQAKRDDPKVIAAEIKEMEGHLKTLKDNPDDYEPEYVEDETAALKLHIKELKARKKEVAANGSLPWAASMGSIESRNLDGKLREQYEANAEADKKLSGGYGYYRASFSEAEVDRARAAGVLLEFGENDAPVILDEDLWKQLVAEVLLRDAERLEARAEAEKKSRPNKANAEALKKKLDEATPAERKALEAELAAREAERALRAGKLLWAGPDSPARAANHDLFRSLFDKASRVKVDADVARMFAWAMFGSEPGFRPDGKLDSYQGSGARERWEPILQRVKACVPDLSSIETPVSEKTGKELKPKVAYATDKQAYDWVWKYLDGAKTPEEIFGRALVIVGLSTESVAHAIAGSPMNRPNPMRMFSRKEAADKARAKLLKPFVPASIGKVKSQVRRAYKAAGSGTDDRI